MPASDDCTALNPPGGRAPASAQEAWGPLTCAQRTWHPAMRQVHERFDGGILVVVFGLPPTRHVPVHKERHAMRRRAVRTLGQVEGRNNQPSDVDLRPPKSRRPTNAGRGWRGRWNGWAARTRHPPAPAVRRSSRRSARRFGRRARAETRGHSPQHRTCNTRPPRRRLASLRTVATHTHPSKVRTRVPGQRRGKALRDAGGAAPSEHVDAVSTSTFRARSRAHGLPSASWVRGKTATC